MWLNNPTVHQIELNVYRFLHLVCTISLFLHCPKGNRFLWDITQNVSGKRVTSRNISCSIWFSSTFPDISRKFWLPFGQCIHQNINVYSQTARVQFPGGPVPGLHQLLQPEHVDEGGPEGLAHKKVDRQVAGSIQDLQQ